MGAVLVLAAALTLFLTGRGTRCCQTVARAVGCVCERSRKQGKKGRSRNYVTPDETARVCGGDPKLLAPQSKAWQGYSSRRIAKRRIRIKSKMVSKSDTGKE